MIRSLFRILIALKVLSQLDLKGKSWCNEEIEKNMKLMYYKETLNPRLEDQNYLYIVGTLMYEK